MPVTMNDTTKSNLWAYVAGLVFGVGLVLAGMTDPAKVIGFLDLFGDWDGSLMFVMGGAIAMHFILFRVVTKRASPLFDTRFHLPTRRDIDPRLVTGAALFGIGWGLAGFCPGPGIVSLGAGSTAAIVFVLAMSIGMWLQDATDKLSPSDSMEGVPWQSSS